MSALLVGPVLLPLLTLVLCLLLRRHARLLKLVSLSGSALLLGLGLSLVWLAAGDIAIVR
mgnify:CR=1 FL=1